MNKKYIPDKNFEGVDFSENKLTKGEYENCIFNNCIFSNCDLSNVNFIECIFENCDFSMAEISAAVFRDVLFKTSKLLGLNFEHCNNLLISMDFKSCQLNLSSFYQLNLKNTTFKDSSLQEVDFTETDLTGSTFSNCNLSGAIFNKSILNKADFRTSYNFSIDPEINQIRKAKFSLAEIPGLLNKYDIEID